MLGLELSGKSEVAWEPSFELDPFVAEQLSFARWAPSRRGFQHRPKSMDDAGHTGKYHEGCAGVSAK